MVLILPLVRRTLLRLPTSDNIIQPYIAGDRIYPPTVDSRRDAHRIVSLNRLVFRSSQDIDAPLCRT